MKCELWRKLFKIEIKVIDKDLIGATCVLAHSRGQRNEIGILEGCGINELLRKVVQLGFVLYSIANCQSRCLSSLFGVLRHESWSRGTSSWIRVRMD